MADLIDFPSVQRISAATMSYQAYRFAANGSVRSTLHVEAGDDCEAERRALTLLDGHRLELWSRGRFIAHVPPDDRSMTASVKLGGNPMNIDA